MKARLHGGPLSGKVVENPPSGPDYNSIIVYGKRKMSREQMFKYLREKEPFWPDHPMVQCVYKKTRAAVFVNNAFIDAPCVHPDGSIFYVYDRTIKEHPLRKT